MSQGLDLHPVVVHLHIEGLRPPVSIAASWTESKWKTEMLAFSVIRKPNGEERFDFWRHTHLGPGEYLFRFMTSGGSWFCDPNGTHKTNEFGNLCNVVEVQRPGSQAPSEASITASDDLVGTTVDTSGWNESLLPLIVHHPNLVMGNGVETCSALPCHPSIPNQSQQSDLVLGPTSTPASMLHSPCDKVASPKTEHATEFELGFERILNLLQLQQGTSIELTPPNDGNRRRATLIKALEASEESSKDVPQSGKKEC